MSKNLIKSESMKLEYCASIVTVKEVKPIEGSDFLGTVEIDGLPIVVRKDDVRAGEKALYASNETCLSDRFLKYNNLYNINNYNLNSNAWRVGKLIEEGRKDDAKKLCGFFDESGRVRTIRLRNQQSFGFIFSIQNLKDAYQIDVNLDDYLDGYCFDTIHYHDRVTHKDMDDVFIKAYVPPVKVGQPYGNRHKTKGAQKRIKRFDQIIPGEFVFHYDTTPLAKALESFGPDDTITITTKMHGTSMIFANVLSNIPDHLPLWKRAVNGIAKLMKHSPVYPVSHVGYSEIFSSRTVIKNRYINQDQPRSYSQSYYDTDVWGEMARRLHGIIPRGMTVYGEIVGYLPGTSKMIQKDYDYGCREGECKMMVYRITTEDESGKRNEWDVQKVHDYIETLSEDHPDAGLIPIEILYHGSIYHCTDVSDPSWREQFLNSLKTSYGMEKREHHCIYHKVPREGIVLRIDGDPRQEAFKLKSQAFLTGEAKLIDTGSVDIEMTQTDY